MELDSLFSASLDWMDFLTVKKKKKKIENSCFYLNFKQEFSLHWHTGEEELLWELSRLSETIQHECPSICLWQAVAGIHCLHSHKTALIITYVTTLLPPAVWCLGLFQNMLTRNKARLLKREHLLHHVIKHSKHLNTAPLHLHIRRRNTSDEQLLIAAYRVISSTFLRQRWLKPEERGSKARCSEDLGARSSKTARRVETGCLSRNEANKIWIWRWTQTQSTVGGATQHTDHVQEGPDWMVFISLPTSC